MTFKSFDVLVVGYGPTGATLANLLALRGLTVAVADQETEIYDKPRASSADHEAMRIFQECGLADEIEVDTSPHPGCDYFGLYGQLIKRFDPQPPPFPLSWEPTFMFVQPKLEATLRRGAERHAGVATFLGHALESFSQDRLSVSALLRRRRDMAAVPIDAKYLLAADGSRSTVRRGQGIASEDLDFDEWWVVIDAWLEGAADLPVRTAQFCNPARPVTYIVGHGNLRRWEIKLLPGESPEEFKSEKDVKRLLATITDISPLRFWRTAVYEFHAVLAQRWREGRVFLVGDAAHQTPPFMAQGMCAGIRDAANLAWKIEAVERHGFSDSVLDTYEQERLPHVRTIVGHAKDFGKIIGELDRGAAKLRDERLEAELKAGIAETIRQRFIPNLSSGLIALDSDGKPSRAAGTILVQPQVIDGEGNIQRLDDVTSRGFLLLSTTEEPLTWLDEECRAFWSRIEGSSACVCALNESASAMCFRASTILFSDWMKSLNAKIVVVRPDKYIFGAAETQVELNSILRQLAKQVDVL